nr:hypothetical protein DA06_10895 [Georgenia sp. SUBG003]
MLAAAVEDQHAAARVRRGQGARGGVGDVVGDEPDLLGVEPGQRRGQELRGASRVGLTQVVPGVHQPHLLGGAGEVRVVGVGDDIQVRGPQPRLREAPAHGELRQLPGGERHRPLAVLAAAEPLLLRGGDDPPVDHQGCGRVVKQGVDSQYAHEWRTSSDSFTVTYR